MDVIIAVLNRLFDENNTELYVGKKQNMFEIHNRTNNILNKINQYSKHVSRKNKGTYIIQPSKNLPFILNKTNYNNMKTIRQTRKSKKQHKYNNATSNYNVINLI